MLVAFFLSIAIWIEAVPAQTGDDRRQQATLALQQAEQALQVAEARSALWTTAVDALNAARSAYAKEDFAAAARFARTAIEQARLGIAQLEYPPLRF